jgi:hypothetical protein
MPQLASLRPFIDRFRITYAQNPARVRAAFVAVLAVAVVGVSVKYAIKVSKPGDDGELSRSAFLRWRPLIHDLFAGHNVYIGVNEYPNPPIMAVVLKPFANLPPLVGAMTWFYAKVLMAVLAAVWVFRLVEERQGDKETRRGGDKETRRGGDKETRRQGDRGFSLLSPSPYLLVSPSQPNRFPDSAKALAILLALPPLIGDLSHNNVNIFILFLIAACLEAYRRGWDVVSGLVLGLAIACKVTPLMFVAYFIWKRAGMVLVGCAAGLVLWLAVVPGMLFGFERNAQLLEDWYSLMVRPSLVENEVTSEHPNQAIPGVVYRLFTHSPSFIEYDQTPHGDIPRPAAFHNFADMGTDTARWVVKGCLVAFAILIVGLCRGPRTERQGWRFAAECSLIVLGMLLFSERTWKHHSVTLLLPFAVLAYAVVALDRGSRSRQWLIGILAAAALLMNGTGMLADHAADLAMVYGSYTIAFLLLTAGLAGLLIGAGSGWAPRSSP